jgi:hypothetical protein
MFETRQLAQPREQPPAPYPAQSFRRIKLRAMVRRPRAAFHTRAGPGRQVFITVLIRDASMTFEEFRAVDLRVT